MPESSFTGLVPWGPTTITRAFILNAVVLALIAGISIEVRGVLNIYGLTKRFSRFEKMTLTIMATFVIGVAVYFVTRLFFGFGSGMVSSQEFTFF